MATNLPPFRPVVIGRDGLTTPVPLAVTRIGTDQFVTINGKTGLFTPIGDTKDTPLGPDERANLLAVIDQLKQRLIASDARLAQLEQDLTTLRDAPATASDFASGVQQSIDELAQRLTETRNPVSNFAVREFKLDASVFVQVAPTGHIEYRFVQPGDAVIDQAVSKLSLTIVPLPKDNLAGVFTPNLFQPGVSVAALPGIEPAQVQRLESGGTYTMGEFLQASTRMRAQVYLEALLEVKREQLALWAQQALLMTLRGVDGRVATLLTLAGLGSFNALAQTAAADAVTRYDNARAARPDLDAGPLDPALLAQWTSAARQYLGLPALE